MPSKLRSLLTSRVFWLAVVVLAVGIASWRWWASRQLPAPYNAAQVVDEAAFEERWGIHVTLVGVSAGGGLVDFRYTVIEPDKALAVLDNAEYRPVLVDEATNTLLLPAPSPSTHRGKPNPGQIFIILYPNPGGVVQVGSQVSVIVGGLRLQHFVVK